VPKAVQPQDNRIPSFNPQQELEQFMQNIGNDLKDFNTFGLAKRPVRQPPTAFFGGSSQPRPALASSNADSWAPPPPQHNSPLRSKASQFKRRGDYAATAPTQSSPVMIKPRDRLTGIKELGYRNKATRRGDGFSEAGNGGGITADGDGAGTTSGVPSEEGDGNKKATYESDDPGHKYESIPLEGGGAEGGGAAEQEERQDVVNYGYHPIIDFFNSQAYR
jgi:hypothetical protein